MDKKWYKISFAVSSQDWEKIKNKILSINFIDKEPILTRHKPHIDFICATFTSNFLQDIWTVIDILPYTAEIIKHKMY